MAHIAILGSGLGGMPMAFEMKEQLRPGDRLTVVSNGSTFQFTPSNPWVAVGWRKREDVELALPPLLRKMGIGFVSAGAERVEPERNRIRLKDGNFVDYDFLVVATGPELAFDEIPGLGPAGHTQSICTVDHALRAEEAWRAFVASPGPIVVGAAQGVSCFGPAYEYAMILDTDLRRRRIRDKVPMTFVTSEPYVGHLGLGGVGDTKGLLESALRQRHIKWIVNAKTARIEAGKLFAAEVDDDGKEKKQHELPFTFAMMMPPFRGIRALAGIEGLVNPRGFVAVDKHQRNPRYPNVFGVGVCIAIPPAEATPVPTGVPKTGFMIESMVTAAAHNIRALLDGRPAKAEATWNAVCLADFGDTGVAFVAIPQIPPRNVNWSSEGRWVHLAKVAFEKYFLRKVRKGTSEPLYEKYIMKLAGIEKLKPAAK
ncbi:MAG: NAD(P)/FAD-dependent oxidoreductase [Candidatus Odyssella sp.]|nr:NAD(P)/FAD-dependent oxidoreductase [Candidatus Odyssella sp.]